MDAEKTQDIRELLLASNIYAYICELSYLSFMTIFATIDLVSSVLKEFLSNEILSSDQREVSPMRSLYLPALVTQHILI